MLPAKELYVAGCYVCVCRWDYVMVFRLKEYRCVPPSTLTVLRAMARAGLVFEGEFDQEGLLLFIKITASRHRLERHADAIDFQMLGE